MAIVPSTMAPCNNPAVEKISFPSSDPITAPEESSCCQSSCKQTMNQGHRQNSSVTNTFSKVSPSKDTFVRDSLDKTNNWDEDGDTQLCFTLPGSEISKENSRVYKYKGSLADSLAKIDRGGGDEDTQANVMFMSSPKQRFKDSRVSMYHWPLTDTTTTKEHNVVAHPHDAPRSGESVGETGVEEIIVNVNTGRTIGLPTAKQLHKITDSTRGNRRGRV